MIYKHKCGQFIDDYKVYFDDRFQRFVSEFRIDGMRYVACPKCKKILKPWDLDTSPKYIIYPDYKKI